jgi:hypothetical protein
MKAHIYIVLLLNFFPLYAMEEGGIPTIHDLLQLIQPPEHRFRISGIKNLIASKQMRRSSGIDLDNLDLGQNHDPVLSGLLTLYKDVVVCHDLALKQGTNNYNFLQDSRKPHLIKFCDDRGKNLLHRAIEARNNGLITYLMENQPELLFLTDDNNKKPTEYICSSDELLQNLLGKYIILTREVALEGSPKNQALLSSPVNL